MSRESTRADSQPAMDSRHSDAQQTYRPSSGEQETRAAFPVEEGWLPSNGLRRIRYFQLDCPRPNIFFAGESGSPALMILHRGFSGSELRSRRGEKPSRSVRTLSGQRRLWHPINLFVGTRGQQKRCKSGDRMDRRPTHVECRRTPKGICFDSNERPATIRLPPAAILFTSFLMSQNHNLSFQLPGRWPMNVFGGFLQSSSFPGRCCAIQ